MSLKSESFFSLSILIWLQKCKILSMNFLLVSLIDYIFHMPCSLSKHFPPSFVLRFPPQEALAATVLDECFQHFESNFMAIVKENLENTELFSNSCLYHAGGLTYKEFVVRAVAASVS